MSGRKGRKTRAADCLTIPEFYDDRTIFVTGATGFMGKVLLEKLLRSCPRIKRIYILMRSKKGKTPQERLQEMFELPMFIRIKRGDVDAFKKVVALQGDASEIGLGLAPEDAQKLKDEVSIVFHVAASVRFDDTLKSSAFMNLRGTYETIQLALQMKKLDCFLHMSTAYCIEHRESIEEILYPPPADWRQILKLCEHVDNDLLEIMVPKLMGHHPNTYTFTKALSEQLVVDFSDRIPAIIMRPSIVISAVSEPLPGWVDNFNGPVGLIVGSGKGIVRIIYSNPRVRSDFIPVDLAVKAMIVCVWSRAMNIDSVDGIEVYNAAAGGIKAITQAEMVKVGHFVAEDAPLNNILWLPGGNVTMCRFNYLLQVIFFHFIPAVIIDAILKYLGHKPLLERIQRKVYVANTALEYFVTRQWNFVNQKLIAMDQEILNSDRAAFSYYLPELDPIEYFRTASYGGRQYLMKEDNCDLEPARKHYWRMYYVDKAVRLLFLIFCCYLAVKFNIIHFLSYWIREAMSLIQS